MLLDLFVDTHINAESVRIDHARMFLLLQVHQFGCQAFVNAGEMPTCFSGGIRIAQMQADRTDLSTAAISLCDAFLRSTECAGALNLGFQMQN